MPDMPRTYSVPSEPEWFVWEDRESEVDGTPVSVDAPWGPAPILRSDEVHDGGAPRSHDARHRHVQRRRVYGDEKVGPGSVGVRASGFEDAHVVRQATENPVKARVRTGHRIRDGFNSECAQAVPSDCGDDRWGSTSFGCDPAELVDESRSVDLAGDLGRRDENPERALFGQGEVRCGVDDAVGVPYVIHESSEYAAAPGNMGEVAQWRSECAADRAGEFEACASFGAESAHRRRA